MSKQVIDTDQKTTVDIDTDDTTWTIEQDVTISVSNGYGILESGNGNTIDLLGDIKVSGDDYAGVRFEGSDSSLDVEADAVIKATKAGAGIQYDGKGGEIDIAGVVKGGDYGLHGAKWAVLDNSGQVHGDIAIQFDGAGTVIANSGVIAGTTVGFESKANGTAIVNDAGATISADDTGILLKGDDGDQAALANKGSIDAAVAILDGKDDLNMTNSGSITGDIKLGDGDDRFDTRKGTVDGQIIGGDGDDTYLIGKQSVDIVEKSDGGSDTVTTQATYTLGDNLENLILTGSKDVDGTGNDASNSIAGNSGDNQISGGDGADILAGGAGTDMLTGGKGIDIFVFATGSGKDTITDFEDHIDRIECDQVQSSDDFDKLSIKQSGDDTVVDFGDGDKLTLQNFDKDNLSYDDFNV